MTISKDEAIELALSLGLAKTVGTLGNKVFNHAQVVAFTVAIEARSRENERKACKAICDHNAGKSDHPMNYAKDCARDIAARGKVG
jgi:hypothetical protein